MIKKKKPDTATGLLAAGKEKIVKGSGSFVQQPTNKASAAPQPPKPTAAQAAPAEQRVKIHKDQYGNITDYEVETSEGKTFLNPKKWSELVEAKSRGKAPTGDKVLEKMYEDWQLAGIKRNVESPEFKMKALQEGMEKKKKEEIMGEAFPEAPKQINPYTGQPITAELPQVEGQAPTSKSAALKEAGQAALTGAAAGTAGGAVTGAAGGAFFGGVGAIPGAIGGAIIGAVGTGISAGVYKYSNEIKNQKSRSVSEAAGLATEAGRSIRRTIKDAATGAISAEDAAEQFEKDKEYLSIAQANLQSHIKKEGEDYWRKYGMDEQVAIEREISKLNMYVTQLQTNLANPDPKKAALYALFSEDEFE